MPSRSRTESSARTTRTAPPRARSCRRPRGLSTLEPPVERGDAGRPGRAGPCPPPGRRRRRRRRAPRPITRAVRRASTLTSACVASRVLGDVRERLGDDEVGGRLDRRAAAASSGTRVELDRHRRAAGQRLERRRRGRGRSARAGWMPRASSRSSSVASRELRDAPRRAAPRPPRGRSSSFARASRSVSASATSRCCAPSCRSRSRRRRSVVAGLDDARARVAQLLDARAQLGVEALVLQRQRGGRAGGRGSARAPRRARRRGRSRAIGSPSRSTAAPARPDRARGSSTGRPSAST